MSAASAAPNANLAFAAALFAELAKTGVRHVCVCPGSRSAPLAVAAAREPGLRCWSHVDERSAGFFALGLAKATRTPVAVVCTSGTAAANLHPAVIEAHYARVPLLALTADRPHELRDWGAGQTIDQVRLYGSHVRWFAEAATPAPPGERLRYARALAGRAVAEASGPPAGPVHLNLPFREPLDPAPGPPLSPGALAEGRETRPFVRVQRPTAVPEPETVADLFERVTACPRGVLVCGPADAGPDLPEAATGLARLAGWPLLADPASGLRCGPHTETGPVLGASDLFLRHAGFAERFTPDLVLRLGAPPTSKALRLWLERRPPGHLVVVDPGGGWEDPSHLASDFVRADPTELCLLLARRLEARPPQRDGRWLDAFVQAESSATRAVARTLDADPSLLSPRAVRELADALPEGALLYVASSMAIRDLDCFLPASRRGLRVLCNRGANGIDGLLSSAAGASAGTDAPVVLLTGDLAFVHDAGGLLAARRHGLRLVVVVVDDGGGGIFSYLPIASHEDVAFDELFRVPHGLDLAAVAHGYGAAFTRVTGAAHLRAALKDALAGDGPVASADGGARVIQVPVDAERNVAQHRALDDAVAAELRQSVLRP